MPGADAGKGTGAGGRLVVWRLGEATLATPLAHTTEIAAVASDGRAVSRAGRLELHAIQGVHGDDAPRRAVIVTVGDRTVALPADEIEGVVDAGTEEVESPPAWLAGIEARHLAGLVRLEGERVAALLDVDTLGDDAGDP